MDDSRDSEAGAGLFSFSFSRGAAGNVSAHEEPLTREPPLQQPVQGARWGLERVQQQLGEGGQPSPAVPRTGLGSHALQRRSGALDQIRKSLGALDEVIASNGRSPSPSSLRPPLHTPGSLLREVFRSSSRPLTAEATPTAPPPHPGRQVAAAYDTPKASLSIMDASGFTRELLLAPTPQHDTSTQLGSVFDMTTLGHTHLEASGMQGAESDSALSQDPAMRTSRELVHAFHRCCSSHHLPASVLELAHSLEECCEVQLAELNKQEEQTKATLSPQILTDLNLEQSTWQLLYVLYRDRVASEVEGGDDPMEESLISGGSDKEVAADFFHKDSSVRQAQLVVDWLERTACLNLDSFPSKVNYFADNVLWENTLHDIKNGIGRDHLVTELDPDAPARQGRHLSELDAKDEGSLVRHLFTCVRAGRINEAQELCIRCGQAWRAASLEGWKLYHDPNMDKAASDGLEPTEGNPRRSLWKISCWAIAAENSFSAYERAVYAALSGNLKQILPVCQSWFDNVWAYFKVMVDVLTEQQVRAGGQCSDGDLEELPADYWNAIVVPEVIFQEIEASPSQLVRKDSRNHFHVMQKFIILGDMEGLVSEMAGWLDDDPNIYKLRFMAHMVLFIGGLGVPVDEEKATCILEAYVKELVASGYHTLVALYTARLPAPLQVSCYASLLEGVEEQEQRRLCLQLGKEAGLDLAVITKSVVENIRDLGTEDVLNTTTTLELGSEVAITKLDKSKIEVINWLVFEETQRSEAIRQGNALIRQFLAMRKHSAAREVFMKIPADSVEVATHNWKRKEGDMPLPSDVCNDIREYYSIQAYLDANDSFNVWFQYFHHSRPEAPPPPVAGDFKDQVTHEHRMKQYEAQSDKWEAQFTLYTADCKTKLYHVLQFEGGWMVDHPEDPAPPPADEPSPRCSQLSLLRQICLPQTCFLLHSLLHSTHQLQECLRLADVVASGNANLFQVFRKDELQKLLSLLQSSAVALLDDPHTDGLGYPL